MKRSLEVRVSGIPTGLLYQDEYGRFGFMFFDRYRANPNRPVLSEYYEQRGLADDPPAKGGLPPWFGNLVLEGRLRELLGLGPPGDSADFGFLAAVGNDLLGAVTLHPVDGAERSPEQDGAPLVRSATGRLRFSLGGMQLKHSVRVRDGKLVAPVHGEVGYYIAKFPDDRLPGVPEVEHAIMSWGSAAGLTVAETRLVGSSEIGDLPGIGVMGAERALLVKRFDRRDGQRVHAEEFAQVFGIPGQPADARYQSRGWRHQLFLVHAVSPADVAEYLGRYLFTLASGNEDAHNKNWALYYPDGRPRLAPAYDLLFPGAWRGIEPDFYRGPTFKLGHTRRRWDQVTLPDVARILRDARVDSFATPEGDIDTSSFADWIRAQLKRMRGTLDVALSLGPPGLDARLRAHWRDVPLLRDVGGPP